MVITLLLYLTNLIGPNKGKEVTKLKFPGNRKEVIFNYNFDCPFDHMCKISVFVISLVWFLSYLRCHRKLPSVAHIAQYLLLITRINVEWLYYYYGEGGGTPIIFINRMNLPVLAFSEHRQTDKCRFVSITFISCVVLGQTKDPLYSYVVVVPTTIILFELPETASKRLKRFCTYIYTDICT